MNQPANSIAERFAEAWVNRTHRVAGRRLAPYCLHHIALLDAMGNPLAIENVAADAKITWADLIQATIICSTPYETEVRVPRFPLFWRFLIYLLRWDLATECRRFRAYQNDFQSQPEIFSTESGKELTAPGLLARVVFLQLHCHMDERRIWTMPVGKALWTYACAAEQLSDHISLLQDQESEMMRILKAIQEGRLSPDTKLPSLHPREKLSPEIFGSEPP